MPPVAVLHGTAFGDCDAVAIPRPFGTARSLLASATSLKVAPPVERDAVAMPSAQRSGTGPASFDSSGKSPLLRRTATRIPPDALPTVIGCARVARIDDGPIDAAPVQPSDGGSRVVTSTTPPNRSPYAACIAPSCT